MTFRTWIAKTCRLWRVLALSGLVLAGVVVMLMVRTTPAERIRGGKEVAALTPATTLAWVEVRHPERLAREIGALTRGSAIENLPTLMSKYRERLPQDGSYYFYGTPGVSELMILGSPELLRDFGRVQGAGIGVTRITREGPEFLGVILPGESTFPGVYARAGATFSQMRIPQTVEGVPIFRQYRRRYARKTARKDEPTPQPRKEYTGPALSFAGSRPGLASVVIVGSSVKDVGEVIRHYKHKSANPVLTTRVAFRNAAKWRDRPGLFGYADLGAVMAQLEEVSKGGGSPVPPPTYAILKKVVNPNSLATAVASVSLQGGVLEGQLRINRNAGQVSPLLDILPRRKADRDLLHFAPRNSLLAVALDLSDGNQRWLKILKTVDDLARARGERVLPSKALQRMEGALQLKLGKDVLDKVTGAVVVLPEDVLPLVAPAGKEKQMAGPVLVLRAGSVADAQFLEEKALPKLASLVGKGDGPTTVKRVNVSGQRLNLVPAAVMPGVRGVYYARQGNVLVLGINGTHVIQSLLAGNKKEGLLADRQVAAELKDLDRSVVGVVSTGKLLLGTFRMQLTRNRFEEPREAFKDRPLKDGPRRGGKKPRSPALPKELSAAVGAMPLAVFTVDQTDEHPQLTFRQPALRQAVPGIITAWVKEQMEQGLRRAHKRAEERRRERKDDIKDARKDKD